MIQVGFDLLGGRPILLDDCSKIVTIPASSSLAVDTILLSELKSTEYFISVYKQDRTKIRTLNMLVNNINGLLQDAVYARIGNDIQVEISAEVSGLNAELKIVNLESFDINCSFKRTNLN
jgi:hypothetical protein